MSNQMYSVLVDNPWVLKVIISVIKLSELELILVLPDRMQVWIWQIQLD